MKTVISIVLILCLALSLYSFVFHNGETLSFEDAYKGAMSYITDIGSVFNSIRDGVLHFIEVVCDLPGYISTLFGNLATRLGLYLRGFWNNLLKVFNKDTECICENPAECTDCPCNASDCLCGITLDDIGDIGDFPIDDGTHIII